MPQSLQFILIDDVASNNLIARMNIRNVFPGSGVTEFTSAGEGYDYLLQQYSEPGTDEKVILLMDIHMPVMDGWDFLAKFDQLNESIKSKVRVYLLSASINRDDEDRAKADKNVAGSLSKPITKEVLNGLIF